MRSAVIDQAGVVSNVIVGELPDSVPCPDQVEPGWSFDGESFSAPPPGPVPVPEWVWMFQLRMALRRMLLSEEHPGWGDALSALEAYVANAGDPDLVDQLSAASVRRDHLTVAQLAFLFQWPTWRLDEAFRLAATF